MKSYFLEEINNKGGLFCNCIPSLLIMLFINANKIKMHQKYFCFHHDMIDFFNYNVPKHMWSVLLKIFTATKIFFVCQFNVFLSVKNKNKEDMILNTLFNIIFINFITK